MEITVLSITSLAPVIVRDQFVVGTSPVLFLLLVMLSYDSSFLTNIESIIKGATYTDICLQTLVS